MSPHAERGPPCLHHPCGPGSPRRRTPPSPAQRLRSLTAAGGAEPVGGGRVPPGPVRGGREPPSRPPPPFLPGPPDPPAPPPLVGQGLWRPAFHLRIFKSTPMHSRKKV